MEKRVAHQIMEIAAMFEKPCLINIDLADLYSLLEGKEKIMIMTTVIRNEEEIIADKELIEALGMTKAAGIFFSGNVSLGWISEVSSKMQKFFSKDIEVLLGAREEETEEVKVTILAME